MAKNHQLHQQKDKWAAAILFSLVCLALLSPLWSFTDLLFPFVTSKAFMFRIFIELALPCYVYLLCLKKDYRPNLKNPLLLASLVFLLINFISGFFGVNINRSIWGNFERMGGAYYLLHLTLLTFYLVLLGQINDKYLKRMLYVFFGVVGLIVLNGIIGWLGGPTLTKDSSLPDRVSSTLGNPIFLGSFLILPMFLAIFFAMEEEIKRRKILFWLLAGLSFIGIILSVTRGALVGLAVGLLAGCCVYIWLNTAKKIKTYGSLAIVCGVVLISGMFIFHSKLPSSRITRIFNLEDSNSKARILQWKIALSGYKERPMFGVGPENYYIIANKYYNPEIIKYDPSWFDKPHNFILEVLVTTGIVGFLAYMGLIIFGFYALYKAFRYGFLSLLEMSVLIAGFAAYFVQNLFVFDTIAASISFYMFVGFCSFLLNEVSGNEQTKKSNYQYTFASWSFITASVVAIYCVYLTNVIPMIAAKDINYGYAYSSVDINIALDYFHKAVNSPFNFDPQTTAQRFSNLASSVSVDTKADPNQAALIASEALAYTAKAAKSIANDPVLWQSLSSDYYNQALISGKELSPNAESAAQTALKLAPKRFELQQYLLQIYIDQNRWQDTENLTKQMDITFPQTKYTSTYKWVQALAEYNLGKTQQALATVNSLAALNYPPSNQQLANWLLVYFDKNKDYVNALIWCQNFANWFSGEPNNYLNLARAYYKTGQIEQARIVAQKLVDENAANKDQAQALLNALPR